MISFLRTHKVWLKSHFLNNSEERTGYRKQIMVRARLQAFTSL